MSEPLLMAFVATILGLGGTAFWASGLYLQTPIFVKKIFQIFKTFLGVVVGVAGYALLTVAIAVSAIAYLLTYDD